jgi:hypothetical protein
MSTKPQIKNLYDSIKNILPSSKFLDENLFVVKMDDTNHIYYEFHNGVLEDSKFKLNLSIPYHLGEALGVYLSITIPQFIHSGTLFEPTSDGNFIANNVLDSIGEQNSNSLSSEEVLNKCREYIKLFLDAYTHKDKVIFSLIEKNLTSTSDDNYTFKEISINFQQPVTENKNNYLFYFDEKTKYVYLNDITSENYRSVTNAIEELATQIYQTYLSSYNANEITWINMFININGQGIVLQNIKLEANFEIYTPNFINRIFGKKKKELFVHYHSPQFQPHAYIEKRDIRLTWLNILNINKNQIIFVS